MWQLSGTIEDIVTKLVDPRNSFFEPSFNQGRLARVEHFCFKSDANVFENIESYKAFLRAEAAAIGKNVCN